MNASRGGGASVKKQSAGELRLHKDKSGMNLRSSWTISFANGKDDLMKRPSTLTPMMGVVAGLLVENSLKIKLNFGEVYTYLKEYMLVKPATDAASKAKMEAEAATAIDDGRLHDDNESNIR
ncbi:Uncharacterized protein Rs2_03133 [Raphanus sativus]|nr:Uncharacterized protein Rs2_03133 [Raphanus sativus]